MIGRKKNTFFTLHKLLRDIEKDKDNIELVRNMNLLLLKEILLTEKGIVRHKVKLRSLTVELKSTRPPKALSGKIKLKIQREHRYIKYYNDQLYAWKCFGDALAYTYLDKYAIKHAFYETKTYKVKQPAGMLSGKAGLVNERSMLLNAIDNNVPAILCDLTNTLRYGDVCLLGASDPYFIEVKSGKILNQRGKRQAESLNSLLDFLEKDEAEDFHHRGISKRIELSVPERTHEALMNEAIQKASQSGYSIFSPEAGLLYIAAYGEWPEEGLSKARDMTNPALYLLNTAKRMQAWGIYNPFMLTIRDSQHLLDFITGELTLAVIIDRDMLVRKMQRPSWNVELNADIDADYMILCQHKETEFYIGVSAPLIARIAYEFVSLQWFVETQAPREDKLIKQLSEGKKSATR